MVMNRQLTAMNYQPRTMNQLIKQPEFNGVFNRF